MSAIHMRENTHSSTGGEAYQTTEHQDTSCIEPTLSADCYLEYKPRKSFAKLVQEVDDLVEDLEGTAEEGRDIFIELTNVKLKDLDAIERELSRYSLEKQCRFMFEERESLLHIRYMPSAIHEPLPRYFDVRVTEIVGQRFAPEHWRNRLKLYGSTTVSLNGSSGNVYKQADSACSPKFLDYRVPSLPPRVVLEVGYSESWCGPDEMLSFG